MCFYPIAHGRPCHATVCSQFAETYTKKMAGEHMFHGKSGKYLKF